MGSLNTENNSIHRSELGKNGLAKRPYEIEEKAESKFALNIAIGFLITNVIILCKSVFFGEDSAASQDAENKPLKKPAEQNFITKDPAEKNLKQPTETEPQEETPEEEPSNITLKPVDERKTSNSLTPSNPEEYLDVKQPETGFTSYQPVLNSGSRLYEKSSNTNADNIIPFPASSARQASAAPPASEGGAPTLSVGDRVNDQFEDNQPPLGGNNQPNRLPVVIAPVLLSQLYINQSVIIGMSELLSNSYDPDGDNLTIRNFTASKGTVKVNEDGSWSFTPPEGHLGEIIFTYEIDDGTASVIQTAELTVEPLPGKEIFGTLNPDLLVGTPGRDRIFGEEDDDTILAREENDEIYGGAGNDRILGGSGNDIIYGGPGDDIIFGQEGDDFISGGEGKDNIDGGEGDDTLRGDEDDDIILAGKGDDKSLGGEGNDIIDGGEGNDFMDGGAGEDDLQSASGNNIFIGGADNDKATGGVNEDQFIAAINDGDDEYDGGDGIDRLDLSATSKDAVIDLLSQTATSEEIGNDIIRNIETVYGSQGNDLFIDDEEENTFRGNAGEDVFMFVTGNKSGKGGGKKDRIEDFEVGDKIDLRQFDSNADEDGWQKLTFKYDQAEFDGVGQAIYKYVDEDSNTVTIVQFNFENDADDDPDKDVDYEIVIVGRHTLDEANFLT